MLVGSTTRNKRRTAASCETGQQTPTGFSLALPLCPGEAPVQHDGRSSMGQRSWAQRYSSSSSLTGWLPRLSCSAIVLQGQKGRDRTAAGPCLQFMPWTSWRGVFWALCRASQELWSCLALQKGMNLRNVGSGPRKLPELQNSPAAKVLRSDSGDVHESSF